MRENYYYEEYGKRAEEYAEKKLLEQGITKEQIEKFKSKGNCLGCAYQHSMCQCAFGGSAHPDTNERIAWVKRLIEEDK